MSEHFDVGLEMKFLAETGVFEGYASVFHVTDRANDRIQPGAFRESLARFQAEKTLPPLLWQHDASEPIGAWREMYEDHHGLFVKGELFVHDIPLAREAHKLLCEKVVTGLSIGYRTKESYRDEKTGVRVLTNLELMEVSLVTFPANEQARVAQVKNFFEAGNMPSQREFEAFLRQAGFSRKMAKGLVAQGYKAIGGYQEDEEDTVLQFRLALLSGAVANFKATLAGGIPEDEREIKSYLRILSNIEMSLEGLKAGYNPAQPRVPRGNTEAGQWAETGRGGGGNRKPAVAKPTRRPVLQPLPRRRPASLEEQEALAHRINENAPEGLSPRDLEVDPRFGLPRWYVEGAVGRVGNPLTDAVAVVTAGEGAAVANILRARAVGRVLAEESNAKIKRAADAVEEFLGGRPDPKDVKINDHGDIIIIGGIENFEWM